MIVLKAMSLFNSSTFCKKFHEKMNSVVFLISWPLSSIPLANRVREPKVKDYENNPDYLFAIHVFGRIGTWLGLQGFGR